MWDGMATICKDDLPDGESEIFFGKPEITLDTPVNKPVDKPPDGQISWRVDALH
jgi:hypothetical protein